MNYLVDSDAFRLLVPEILVVGVAIWAYIGGAFNRARLLWYFGALVGLGLAAYALRVQTYTPALYGRTFGPLVFDSFGLTARWLVLGIGALLVLQSTRAAEDDLTTEYLGSLLLVLAGLMLASLARDLVLLFVALELVSIPTYILLFLGRRPGGAHEATVKYFFLSVLSSAFFLYGLSFLYGLGGSTLLDEIRVRLAEMEPGGLHNLLPLALMLILAGLGFRLTIAPFHFYAPDVYQGTTAGNAGLLAVAPKIAGVVVLLRLLASLPGTEVLAWKTALVLALVTMTLGNTLALWQTNIRRMMAYSSIAHGGYLLVGLAAGLALKEGGGETTAIDGLAAMLLYLVVYVLATAGVFAALAHWAGPEGEVDTLDDLAGVSKSQPLVTACAALCLFSLAGLPPLAGFLGKLMLLLSALDAAGVAENALLFRVLAVALGLNAAVACAYYLRIVAAMYFREPKGVARAGGSLGAGLASLVAAAGVLVATWYGGSLTEQATAASRSLYQETAPPVDASAQLSQVAEPRQ